MKVIKIIECRLCGQEYYVGEDTVKLVAFDEISIVVRRISKCSECLKREGRTPGGTKKQ